MRLLGWLHNQIAEKRDGRRRTEGLRFIGTGPVHFVCAEELHGNEANRNSDRV